MKRFTYLLFLILLNAGFLHVTAQTTVCPSCALNYPDNTHLPWSAVPFSESDVLQTAELVPGTGSNPTTIRVWYSDEHALTLGVRSVIVKTKTGTTTTNYTVTPSPASPTCVGTNLLVGSTALSGDQSPNDVAAGGGRPLYPALFVTDLTVNGLTSRAGDWQQGGMPIPPKSVCGTWKAAVKTVDYTKSPAVVTITPDADPAKNGWNLGGGDAPSGGFSSLSKGGYGAEVVWDLDKLGLIPGHNYRFQVMVHDGDQNKSGGDAGEKCFSVVVPPHIAKLTLGNQVWNDFDGDGIRDENEPGIPGATVTLYRETTGDNNPDGPAYKTTISDELGHYQFTDLPEGRYIVSMLVLPGYQKSPNDSAHTGHRITTLYPDNDVDNDNNLVNGPSGLAAEGQPLYTNAITLKAGTEPEGDTNNTLDIAECGNAFIGDFVWYDKNGDGIQQSDEPGINGVTVTITFSDGRTATTTTLTYGHPGYYDFKNLGPGTYKITFPTTVTMDGVTTPLHLSPALQGPDRTKDSNPVDGSPVTVTIIANQSDFTIDAGYTDKSNTTSCPNLSLGNMVFNDANNNGVKDANEPGIGGLTVKLYAASNSTTVSGAAISTIMTAADGTYYFGNLAAGKYIVGVTTTGTSYVLGANSKSNPDDNVDNDNNGVTTVSGEVRSNAITLSPGDEPVNDGSDNNSNLTLDFGLKFGSTPVPCTNHCECRNDCTHTGCGHPNCGHNNCHNDCNHTGCGHPNCGHNSCKNDCNHTGCGHPNCGKKDNARTASADAQSVVTAITAPDLTNTSVSIFPNPANDFIVIKVMAEKGGKGVARITDLSGKLVATKSVVIANGMNMVKFDQLQGLRAGTYYVQLDFNYHTYNQQLIVVK